MPTKVSEALEDVEISFRQLEFAIKLLSFCELGRINPTEFDTDHLVVLHGGSLRFPAGNFSTQDSVEKAAGTGVLIAFSVSVLVLDKAFEVAGLKPDPEAVDEVGRLRTLVHMMRCAQAHGIAEPRWEVRGKYRRPLTINIGASTISLDLSALDGQPFDIDQLGGYVNWYRMRDAAVRLVS
jgi:hypothetical protein